MKYNTKEKTFVLEIGTKVAVIWENGAEKRTLKFAYKLLAKTKEEAEKEFPLLLKKIFKCKGVEIPKKSLHNIKELKPIEKIDFRSKQFKEWAENLTAEI